MAKHSPLAFNNACLTLVMSTAVFLLVSLHSSEATGLPKSLISRWKEATKERNRNKGTFDEKDMGIITMNLEIEHPSTKQSDGEGTEFYCLRKHLSDDDGEVHIVGFAPESRDNDVVKMVLYGCPQVSQGTPGQTSNMCTDQCIGPSVPIYEWERDGCPVYLTRGEVVTVGGPFLIHELFLEVQHTKGASVSAGLTLKVLPESHVHSDETVQKMIAYYQSQPGFEPCDGSASNERASESPASSFIVEERPAEDEPQNVIIPQEAYQADYRFARAYPAPAESPYSANGLDAEEWWPRESIRMGQVAGVDTDQHGLVYAFQRGERRWLPSDFDDNHVFNQKKRAIQNDVVLMMDPHSGYVLDSWGAGRFYMPHGITIDHEGNTWLTDVALHQVFKFPPGKMKPSLVIGKRFQPGSDWKHLCQPTDVAVDSKTGNFFIADGYCNSRVLKLAPNGSVLMEITAPSNPDQPEDLRTFNIPHSLALAEKRQLLCVADREHGRIVCFNSTTGEYDRQITHEEFGGRVFAIAYDKDEDVLYAVNGPTDDEYYPTKGFTIGLDSNRILSTWNRPVGEEQLMEPHDITVHSGEIYVADVGANRVWKFWDEATPSNDVLDNGGWWRG
ncbi:uncharacterized protein LOC117295428 [Asterias rubens]|uniref:uncharacterized protein LOC117295428 n=1 Tax=Asterias rubens TaxID=7604 RepID=UPI001455A20D|nr:uncharacterized protein LOC117295428 [Asterias rubens]